jgi:hypothetical protein
MVSFSSRMITEKLVCEGNRDEYVQILVNDQIQNLRSYGGDIDGLCSLPYFVVNQTFARENGGVMVDVFRDVVRPRSSSPR